jgi:aminomethyltransferase
MKTTGLTGLHKELGAKMAGFAGYEMPIVYTSIKEEHLAVRHQAGMFDVSHMGEFIVRGSDAETFLQRISSNNVSKLKIGQAQYSCIPNTDGGIVDDFLLYKLDDEEFMMVVNAGNIQKDWDWISQFKEGDVELRDISDKEGLLAVQGPKAVEILQELTDVDLAAVSFYHFEVGTFAGIENVIISATGYTGAGGFELYVENTYLIDLWKKILEVGKDKGMVPAGLGCRDTLRLEMGYCLYGNDITDETSPIEAGLGWITKTKKGEFNSVEIFKGQRAEGVSRKLVGFKVDDRRVPRNGYDLLDGDGNKIGHVTSGTLSPCLEIPIGMGYVTKENSSVGTEVLVDTGRKQLKATVCSLPFYIKEE